MAIHQQELYDKIFDRIPCLRFASMNAPYIGKNYGSDADNRILVILCSAYGSSESTAKDLPISDFYKVRPTKDDEQSYPECSRKDVYTLFADFSFVKWNRKKIEQAVISVSPGKTLEDIAHYHFILRPLRKPAETPSSMDLDYAIEAFPKIIDILKPTHILFFGNDCLRTVSRRAFTKPVENKSIERFLSDKGIYFSTVSRRADYQPKTSAVDNQKEINDLLNQIAEQACKFEERANKIKESIRQMEILYEEINKKAGSEMLNASAWGAAAAAAAVGSAVAAPMASVPVIGAVAGALTGASILTLVGKLRTLVGNADSGEDAGMGNKSDFIVNMALENQKKFATITFSEFAIKLNQAGFLTARGEKFSAEGNGPLLLVNKVFKKCIAGQSDYDTAVAIAMTFVNDRTGLPWILNETIEDLVKKGTIAFEDGVLKSPVTDEPITEKDISPKLVKNASIKGVDDKLKGMLVEYLEKKQKYIRESQG